MKSAEKWYDEGVALAKKGKYEEAITHYDKAIEINPKYAKAWRKKGVALEKHKKYEKALKCYETSFSHSKKKTNKFWALRKKADLLLDLKRFEGAVEFFNKTLEIDPGAPVTYRHKAEALIGLKRYEEAIECYNAAIEVSKNNESKYWSVRGKANLLSDLKRFEEAVDAFNLALEIKSDSARAYRHKAKALIGLKRYEEAIECYNAAIEVSKNSESKYWSVRGKADLLLDLGRFEEAVDAFNLALEIKSDSARAYRHKAEALIGLKQYDWAIDCYSAAIEVSESESAKAKALHGTGYIYRMFKKEPEKAIEYYEKATALRDYGWLWCDLGNCYLEKEKPDPEKALDCFDKASKVEANHPFDWHVSSAFHCIGYTYWKFKKEYDKAIEYYTKAIERCQDPERWHYKWSWWDKAHCYLEKENPEPEKALGCFDKVLDVNPKFSDAWHSKGYTYWKYKKDYEKAIECYNKAIERCQDLERWHYKWSWWDMGNCYKELRNLDDALKCFNEAKKAGNPEAEKYIEKIEEEIRKKKEGVGKDFPSNVEVFVGVQKAKFLSKLRENAETRNVQDAHTYARLVIQYFENEPLSDVGREALQELKTEIIGRLEEDFKKDTSMLNSTMKRISSICTIINEG